ncbi:MAG: sel1 repeat family protein [Alphaproteobacteria bacterium]|nr:sel1 repeat family protein [Alphaproteobacteria bacterium]MBT5859585.1 sel1 repeat family protein [Alphaproteobacteria bacterium]
MLQSASDAYQAGDYETATSFWSPLAIRGNAAAQFAMGYMVEEGEGVQQDFGTALRWYERAADQGHALAQYHQGKMYQGGLGVPADTLQAAKWYVLAARQGDPTAQFSLAILYINDPAVTCAAVVPRNCVALLGETPDLSLGAIWYRLAAEQGMSEAQNNLGGLYGAGLGVPQDTIQAYAWFSVAADQGNAAAAENREIAAAGMSPDSLIEARALAADYNTLYVAPNR